MSRSTITRLALTLAVALLAPRAGAQDCSDPMLADPFGCDEALLDVGPAFDLAAFTSAYDATVLYEVPALDLIGFRVADEATRRQIELDLDQTPPRFDAEWRPNSVLRSPECRQFGLGFVELTHDPTDLLAQPAMAAIRLAEAQQRGDGNGVRVAIIDTGVDASHTILAPIVASGGYDFVDDDPDPAEVTNGVDDDGNGTADDGYGHGTAMAGLVATIAPGAEIIPFRVADDECRTTVLRVTAAIIAAHDAGARVITLALTMEDVHDYVGRAIDHVQKLGSVVVVPGGNNEQLGLKYPARERRSLAVTATDDLGVKPAFANWDSKVDLVAPGVGVLTAHPGDVWLRGDGTSYAAAIVAGVAALAVGNNPCATADSIEDLLAVTARPVDDLAANDPWRGELGDGMVDAAAVLSQRLPALPVAALLVAKLTVDRVGFRWTALDGVGLDARIYSVERPDEIALARVNPAECPSCPAPSLALRCDGDATLGSCDELTPGLLTDPQPVLYLQAVGSCQGLDGPL